jgi:hypothetical protein
MIEPEMTFATLKDDMDNAEALQGAMSPLSWNAAHRAFNFNKFHHHS